MDSILLINGIQVDLTNVEIPLDYSSNMFSKPSYVTSNKTHTINIPKTENNNKIFGHADTIGITNKFIRRYNSCRFIKDGVELISDGSAVLISVNEKSYSICLTWGYSTAMIERIKAVTKLSDIYLPDSYNTLEWYAANLLTKHNTSGEPIYTGFANYNCGSVLNNVLLRDIELFPNVNANDPDYQPEFTTRDLLNLNPFITLESIKLGLEDTCDFELRLPSSVENDLKNKCLLLTEDRNTLARNLYKQIDRFYHGLINTRDYVQPPFTNLWCVFQGRTNYNLSNGSRSWIVEEPHKQLNGNLDYEFVKTGSGPLSDYGIKFTKAVSSFVIKVHFKTVNDLGTGGIGSTDFYIRKDEPNPWSGIGTTIYMKQYNDSEYTDTLTILHNFSAGDIIYFSWKYFNDSFTPDLDKCEFTIDITNVVYIDPITTTKKINYPKIFDVESNLPNINAMDFIKFLANIYGLYFGKVDEENVLELREYEDIAAWTYDSFDLSNKFINRSDTKFRLGSFAQDNEFVFVQDDDKNDSFNGSIFVNDKTIKPVTNFATIPFSATYEDLNINQYDVNRDDYDYKVTNHKKTIRVMGLNEISTSTGYGYEFVPSDLKFENLEHRYSSYKDAVYNPTIIEVEVLLATYEIKNFDFNKPVYLSQFGYHFGVLKMRVKKNTCSLILLKL